ncbi:zonular occludens toxin family protein [Pasteurella multocida]|uniref:zonular occludens toxin family protein n=1 Tax=Pasteurella multocida TaxID=747 RepID=UPI002C14E01E|nr:zonular occludens toxin domain-containing protein [Pasteurella multocida]MEB3472288.1 zonular occludens toxin domain-containing protein [Pasteurella multocida]
MAISAYVGVPGSGKSYEVVKSVILPAIEIGRRVVSNVYGLDKEKIYSYLLNKNRKLTANQLGELVYVENEQCLMPDFLPSMENQDSFCQAGDLIVIDEVWRIWGNDKEIPQNHRSFIAEHRHFSHPQTGLTCDLVVINQNVSQIPRFIKDRIETTYRMQKHVALGLRNRYRVDVFQGVKLFKCNRVTYYQEKYDKSIFELYKSYEGSNARETITDKRQSIFSSTKLLVYILGLLVLMGLSVYFFYDFFNTDMQSSSSEEKLIDQSINSQNKPVSSSFDTPKTIVKPLSTKWKIVGELKKNNQSLVVLSDSQGRLRFEPRSQFLFTGRMLQGEIDNQIVNYYSGEMK